MAVSKHARTPQSAPAVQHMASAVVVPVWSFSSSPTSCIQTDFAIAFCSPLKCSAGQCWYPDPSSPLQTNDTITPYASSGYLALLGSHERSEKCLWLGLGVFLGILFLALLNGALDYINGPEEDHASRENDRRASDLLSRVSNAVRDRDAAQSAKSRLEAEKVELQRRVSSQAEEMITIKLELRRLLEEHGECRDRQRAEAQMYRRRHEEDVRAVQAEMNAQMAVCESRHEEEIRRLQTELSSTAIERDRRTEEEVRNLRAELNAKIVERNDAIRQRNEHQGKVVEQKEEIDTLVMRFAYLRESESGNSVDSEEIQRLETEVYDALRAKHRAIRDRDDATLARDQAQSQRDAAQRARDHAVRYRDEAVRKLERLIDGNDPED